MLKRSVSRLGIWLTLLAASVSVAATATAQSGDFAVRPGQDLMELETDAVDIVFPAEALPVAERLAGIFTLVDDADLNTVGPAPPRHLHLVLRTHQGLGNGFVTGTPFHSDWGLTPLPGLLFGAVPWVTTLAVHEYRHVVQYEHFMRSGLMRLARFLVGDFAYIIPNLAVPRWAYEGDAVLTETLLTDGGRGRVPSFDVDLRGRVLNEGWRHYDREVLPSMRRRSGDPYPMGYYLTTYLRREVSPTIIANAGNDGTARFYNIWSFSRALEDRTGQTLPELWEATADDVVARWREQQSSVDALPVASLAFARPGSEPRVYRGDTTPLSYADPIELDGHGVFALRTGFDYTAAVVRVAPHGDEVLARVPLAYPIIASLSGGGDRLAWLEYRPHWRWSMSGRFVVRVHDLSTGRTSTATPRGTYLHAALSPSGERLALVEVDSGYAPHLRVFELATGDFVADHALDPLGLADSLAWGDDALFFTWQTPEGRVGIRRLDLTTGEQREVVPPSTELIYELSYRAPWVFHASTYTGVDAILAVHAETGDRFLVAERPIAARAPSPAPDGETLLFADYATAGFDVARGPLNPDVWTPLAAVVPHPLAYYEDVQDQDPSIAEALADPPAVETEAHRYRAASHIVHPYGWYAVPDVLTRRISLGVSSANLLNTVLMGASYAYDYEDDGHHGAFDVALHAMLPILRLGVAYDQITARTPDDVAVSRDESSVSLGVSLPFFDQRGSASHALLLQTEASVGTIVGDVIVDDTFFLTDDISQTLAARGVYEVWRSGARRALRPPVSLTLDGGGQVGRIAPREGGTVFEQTAWHAAGGLTLPVGVRHTTLRISGATYDRGVLSSYLLPVAYTPGYVASTAPRGERVVASLAFPLYYPEWRLWSAMYVGRFSAEVFGATTWDRAGAGQLVDQTASVGGGLFADYYLLRFPSSIRLGVRGGVTDEEEGFVELAAGFAN